jgi:hypothetical protein
MHVQQLRQHVLQRAVREASRKGKDVDLSMLKKAAMLASTQEAAERLKLQPQPRSCLAIVQAAAAKLGSLAPVICGVPPAPAEPVAGPAAAGLG